MALPAYADTWKDITGKHSVEAEFVVLESGAVTLKKQDGNAVRVPLEKLCADDQRRAQELDNQLRDHGQPGELPSKWTDVSGKYSTEATFVSIEQGNVTLRKLDGTLVIVPVEKLSTADQQRAIELGKLADDAAASNSSAQEPTTTVAGSPNISEPAKIASAVLKPLINATGPDIKVPANFMYVRFSKPFLQEHLCRQVDQTMPVCDTILGASVSGTSRTIAGSTLELINNQSQAQAKLRLAGTTWFQTVAASGPARIYSTGATTFTSTEQIWFDGFNLQHYNDGSVAQTRSETTGIGTCLRFIFGRISLRIASRREAKTHSLSESITSDHTKQKVERAFDSGVADRSNAFREFLRTRYAKLPLEGQFRITDIRCSTSPTNLQIVVVGRGDDSSFFVAEPAALADQGDIELHIHTALVRKAIAEPELRKTLERAAASLIDRPLQAIANASASKTSSPAGQGPNFHWPEGSNSDWLAISWNMKAK